MGSVNTGGDPCKLAANPGDQLSAGQLFELELAKLFGVLPEAPPLVPPSTSLQITHDGPLLPASIWESLQDKFKILHLAPVVGFTSQHPLTLF